MSLIHTCQFCGADSFEYLTELRHHARELVASPAEWMPWTIARPWTALAWGDLAESHGHRRC